jgi:PAS domain-containing protein
LDANTAYQGLLGYSSEEISYLTLYDLLPCSREDTDSYIGRVLERSRYASRGVGIAARMAPWSTWKSARM